MKTETNRIEYKQTLTDNLEKEVVAFLNYRSGGIIYIGIDKTTVKTTVKILELIKENNHITRQELANELGLTVDGVDYNLKKLKMKGLIKRIGPDKGGFWEAIEN